MPKRTDVEKRSDATNQGLPSLDLDTMIGSDVPKEFEFEAVYGDVIMCEVIDENEHGEIYRDGIFIKQDISRRIWRRGKIVLAGPHCVGVEVGDEVAYPSDRGIPMSMVHGRKFIFLNEERLFGKLKPIGHINNL